MIKWTSYQCHGGGSGDGVGDDAADSGISDSGADTTAGGMVWDPGSHVSWNTYLSVHVIDVDFVDLLKYDASVLANDPTYLDELTAGGFAFKNVTAGTLAWELGFQEDDIPLTINGHYVQTLEDVLTTLVDIYDDTAFTVRVQRGGTVVNQDYLIR